MDGERPKRPQMYIKSYGQLRNAKRGKSTPINCLSNTKWSALKNIYTSNIIQTGQVLFMHLGVYVKQLILKRGHKFEREQGKIHEMI